MVKDKHMLHMYNVHTQFNTNPNFGLKLYQQAGSVVVSVYRTRIHIQIYISVALLSFPTTQLEEREMGWQDSLAKHYPIPAFFAAVISNIITGNKAGENQNSTNTNFYDEPSSSYHDYTYSPSEIQPAQYYYPPTPIPTSSSSLKLPKKKKNKTYNQGHQVEYYNNGVNNEQIVKPKGFWRRKGEHVVEKRKGYGEKGTVTRSYVDWNGEEVMEEREYHLQSYYELQMSPAKVVDKRQNKSDYQGAGRTRYY